jgi:hypothetical protein
MTTRRRASSNLYVSSRVLGDLAALIRSHGAYQRRIVRRLGWRGLRRATRRS